MQTEQTDRATLVAFIAQKKINTYEMLRLLVNGDVELAHCGYKSLEDATVDIIKDTSKAIEKATRTHERKWPLGNKE